LSNFFLPRPGSIDANDKKTRYELDNPEFIVTNMFQKPFFSLAKFQDLLEQLVNSWDFDLYDDSPALVACCYRLPSDGIASLLKAPLTSSAAAGAAAPRRQQERSSLSPIKGKALSSDMKKAETALKVRELREHRKNLNENHGEDPLESSRAIAASAVLGRGDYDAERWAARRKRDSSKKKNKKRKASDFSSSSSSSDEDDESSREVRASSPKKKKAKTEITCALLDDIEEEEAEDRAKLSELPELFRQAPTGAGWVMASGGSPQKKDEKNMYPPEKGLFDAHGKVLKRRRWTDEEKTAVKLGARKHGVGKWKLVKDDYPEILRNRTAVQIKDCWRTMVKHNEVKDPAKESESEDEDDEEDDDVVAEAEV